MMNDPYLDDEMRAWEQSSENDIQKINTSQWTLMDSIEYYQKENERLKATANRRLEILKEAIYFLEFNALKNSLYFLGIEDDAGRYHELMNKIYAEPSIPKEMDEK